MTGAMLTLDLASTSLSADGVKAIAEALQENVCASSIKYNLQENTINIFQA
jgi:hypothetical protein